MHESDLRQTALSTRRSSVRGLGLAVAVALAGCASVAPRPPALGLVWAPVDSLDAGLPRGVRVLSGVSASDTLRAWAVVLDGPALDVVLADPAQGVSAFARAPSACVALNAGYFDTGTGAPVGLVVDGGAVRSPALREVARDGLAYPVARGAVGVTGGGRAEIGWTWDDGGRACRFGRPFGNRPGAPSAQGSACEPWPVREAVGAGPVLLRDGRAVVTSDAEAFFGTAIPARRHPRSAVATAPDGRVWLVVVDGRQPASRGVTLGELALVLRGLGATEALNLDGGGSSALAVRVGGRVVRLNRPTGYDVERPVATALVARCD